MSTFPNDMGVDSQASIQIISNPERVRNQYINLISSSNSEILLVFPTINAIHREHSIGIIDELKKAVKRGVKIRILSAEDEFIKNKLDELRSSGIVIRPIETPTESKFKMLIVDKKISFIVETKDDSKAFFADAIGLALLSTAKATVLPFVTIFESFWRETDLYEKARESDRIKDEFVNIAAHELRNPIMPIISGAELIADAISSMNATLTDEEKTQLLFNVQVVVRNASKLLRLSEDILQVSRIDSGTFRLNIEQVQLDRLVRNTIADVEKRYLGEKRDVRIRFDSKLSGDSHDFQIYCDNAKIAQTLFNLLDNAMKFTAKGEITVTATSTEQEAIVQVRDEGSGIDAEIKPRLFEKFVSKSNGGTGLGLYLSRKIVEAHSGRIWCKDNELHRGADCGFTIPTDLHSESIVALEAENTNES